MNISDLRMRDIISVPVLIASEGLQVVYQCDFTGNEKLFPLDLIIGKNFFQDPELKDSDCRPLSFLEENEWSYRGKLVLKFCAELEL